MSEGKCPCCAVDKETILAFIKKYQPTPLYQLQILLCESGKEHDKCRIKILGTILGMDKELKSEMKHYTYNGHQSWQRQYSTKEARKQ